MIPVSVYYYKLLHSEERFMVELNKNYRGYYVNEKWISRSELSESDKAKWKNKWEGRGYKFEKQNDVIIVKNNLNRIVAIIKNGESVQFK